MEQANQVREEHLLMRDQRDTRPIYPGSQGVRSLELPHRHDQPARKGWWAQNNYPLKVAVLVA